MICLVISHVCGFDGLSSHMLLNCKTERMLNCLLVFYLYIFKHAVIPTDFNVSLVRPIIKDRNKPSDDVKNLRPISISNVFSQIFERLLLANMPDLHSTHRNQFGFKRFTSCTHALFAMKETVVNIPKMVHHVMWCH